MKVSNISKSASGTIEAPGKNIRAKSGLNKSILDQGWYKFRAMLEYKSKWNGGNVIAINPKYTSQKCSNCGYTAKENRLSQSRFECITCNTKMNADINAAKNILAAGRAVIACGVEALAATVKQEPLGFREKIPA